MKYEGAHLLMTPPFINQLFYFLDVTRPRRVNRGRIDGTMPMTGLHRWGIALATAAIASATFAGFMSQTVAHAQTGRPQTSRTQTAPPKTARPQNKRVAQTGRTWKVRLYGCLEGKSGTATLPADKVMTETGIQGLDNAILDDITQLEKPEIFNVHVPMYFLNDDMENAFFAPVKVPELIRREGGDPNAPITGTVFFGMKLLRNEYQRSNGSGMSIPAIIAHEYAHAMQSQKGFPYNGKWRELHADFMAGWYTTHRARFRRQDIGQAAANFYQKGDYGFYDEGHHGTPMERKAAFDAGYRLNSQQNVSNGSVAFEYGRRYVEALGAGS